MYLKTQALMLSGLLLKQRYRTFLLLFTFLIVVFLLGEFVPIKSEIISCVPYVPHDRITHFRIISGETSEYNRSVTNYGGPCTKGLSGDNVFHYKLTVW